MKKFCAQVQLAQCTPTDPKATRAIVSLVAQVTLDQYCLVNKSSNVELNLVNQKYQHEFQLTVVANKQQAPEMLIKFYDSQDKLYQIRTIKLFNVSHRQEIKQEGLAGSVLLSAIEPNELLEINNIQMKALLPCISNTIIENIYLEIETTKGFQLFNCNYEIAKDVISCSFTGKFLYVSQFVKAAFVLFFKNYQNQEFRFHISKGNIRIQNKKLICSQLEVYYYNYEQVQTVQGFINANALIFNGSTQVKGLQQNNTVICIELSVNYLSLIQWISVSSQLILFDNSYFNTSDIFQRQVEVYLQNASILAQYDKFLLICQPGKQIEIKLKNETTSNLLYGKTNCCTIPIGEQFQLFIDHQEIKIQAQSELDQYISYFPDLITSQVVVMIYRNKSSYNPTVSQKEYETLVTKYVSKIFPQIQLDQKLEVIYKYLQLFEPQLQFLLKNQQKWNIQKLFDTKEVIDVSIYFSKVSVIKDPTSQFLELLILINNEINYKQLFSKLTDNEISFLCYYSSNYIISFDGEFTFSNFKTYMFQQQKAILQFISSVIEKYSKIIDKYRLGYSSSFISEVLLQNSSTNIICDCLITILLTIREEQKICVSYNSVLQIKLLPQTIGTLYVVKNDECIFAQETENGSIFIPLQEEKSIYSLLELDFFNNASFIFETNYEIFRIFNQTVIIQEIIQIDSKNPITIQWQVQQKSKNVQFQNDNTLSKKFIQYLLSGNSNLDVNQLVTQINQQHIDSLIKLKVVSASIGANTDYNRNIIEQFLTKFHVRQYYRCIQQEEYFKQQFGYDIGSLKQYISRNNLSYDELFLQEISIQTTITKLFEIHYYIFKQKMLIENQIIINLPENDLVFVNSILIKSGLLVKKHGSVTEMEQYLEMKGFSHVNIIDHFNQLIKSLNIYFDQCLYNPTLIVKEYIISCVQQDNLIKLQSISLIEDNDTLNGAFSYLIFGLLAWKQQEEFLSRRFFISYAEEEWSFIYKFLQKQYQYQNQFVNDKILEQFIMSSGGEIYKNILQMKFDKSFILKNFKVLCYDFQNIFVETIAKHKQQPMIIKLLENQTNPHNVIQIFMFNILVIKQIIDQDRDKLHVDYEQDEIDFIIESFSITNISALQFIADQVGKIHTSIELESEINSVTNNEILSQIVTINYQLTKFQPHVSLLPGIELFQIQSQFPLYLDKVVPNSLIRKSLSEYLYEIKYIQKYDPNLSIQSFMLLVNFYYHMKKEHEFLKFNVTKDEFLNISSVLYTLKLPRFVGDISQQDLVFHYIVLHTSLEDLNAMVQIFLTNDKSRWLNECYPRYFKPLSVIKMLLSSLPKNNQELILLMIKNPNQIPKYCVKFIFICVHLLNSYKESCNKKTIIELKQKQINVVSSVIYKLTNNYLSATDSLELNDLLEQFANDDLINIYKLVKMNQNNYFDIQYYVNQMNPISTRMFLLKAFDTLDQCNIDELSGNEIAQGLIYYIILDSQLSLIQGSYNEWQYSCVQYVLTIQGYKFQQIDENKIIKQFDNVRVEDIVELIQQLLSNDIQQAILSKAAKNSYVSRLISNFSDNKKLSKTQLLELIIVVCPEIVDKLSQNLEVSDFLSKNFNQCLHILQNQCGVSIYEQQFSSINALVDSWLNNKQIKHRFMIMNLYLLIDQLITNQKFLHLCFGLQQDECELSKYDTRYRSEVLPYCQLMDLLFQIVFDLHTIKQEKIQSQYLEVDKSQIQTIVQFLVLNKIIQEGDAQAAALETAKQLERFLQNNSEFAAFQEKNLELIINRKYEMDLKQSVPQRNYFTRTIKCLRAGQKVIRNWEVQLTLLYIHCIERRRLFSVDDHEEYHLPLTAIQITQVIQFLIFNQITDYISVEQPTFKALFEQIQLKLLDSDAKYVLNQMIRSPAYIMNMFVLRPPNILQYIKDQINRNSFNEGCNNLLKVCIYKFENEITLSSFEIITLLVFIVIELMNFQKTQAIGSKGFLFNNSFRNKRAANFAKSQIFAEHHLQNELQQNKQNSYTNRLLTNTELVDKYHYKKEDISQLLEDMKYW